MKRLRIFSVFFFALILLGQGSSAFAKTDAPTQVVKSFYAQLVDVMKHGDQLGFGGRYKKLEPAVKTAFDLPLMTRVAVGPIWANTTADEQQQLISSFSDFSVATYASQFKKWDGEQFKVMSEKPAADGGVIVETELQPKESDPVTLNYLMRTDANGKWRIVDVYLAGAISQLATRRAEFSSIVKRDGIEALVNSLGDKAKQMGPS